MVVAACALTVFSTTPAVAIDAYTDEPTSYLPGQSDYVPDELQRGDAGPWVEHLQNRLAEAGYRPGTPDGNFGGATLGAVYAFQKIHKLDRDGIFRSKDWTLLDIKVSLPVASEPDRVEVDLDRQVLYLIERQLVKVVLPISSGNGAAYRNAGGRYVKATTPEGDYRFYRHVNGWRISYLGGLYRPYYFRGGYAIHGSYNVPPYPDSHGCVRVELHDMDYLTTELNIGMPIYVYGNSIERESLLPLLPRPTENGFVTNGGFPLS